VKSLIVKRSVVIDGHKTSVSLEESFWTDLKEIAHTQHTTISKVIEGIDKERQGNLSSAIRLFVLDQVRKHGDPWQYSRARYRKSPKTRRARLRIFTPFLLRCLWRDDYFYQL
jgi:predicted DNA-binding ribbon-helix-helix protein